MSASRANASYVRLDKPIIDGHADDPTLWGTYASVLEEVAAVAGVLRALGVDRGERVLLDLCSEDQTTLAALASWRLGACVVLCDDVALALEVSTPVVVITDTYAKTAPLAAAADPRPGTLIVADADHPPLDERHELAWAIAVRAGKSDPAAAVEVDLEAPALVRVRHRDVSLMPLADLLREGGPSILHR